MSKNIGVLSFPAELQLEFFEPGRASGNFDGLVHHKTCPYAIIAQTMEGRYDIQVGDRFESVPEGRVFLLPAHTPIEIAHVASRRQIMACQWLHLRFSYFGQIDFLSRYELPLVPSASISQAFGSLIEEALTFGPDRSDVAAWISRYEVALKILRIVDTSFPTRPQSPERTRFAKVFLHIRENWGQPLDVSQLARIAGLSPAQFHVLFKKAMGSGPMTYVRKVRLEAASRQLVASEATLTQIAEANGFADAFHFSHCFKKHFGIAPREYRHRHLESSL